MRREVSLYLDAARVVAATLVFLGHANGLTNGAFGNFGVHSVDAVAIFFVLSGFVIAYVQSRREQSWQAYAQARCLRMYSVAIPAIVVTIVCDAIRHAPPSDADQVVSSLLFVGEFWSRHVYIGSNEPYWSMGYEAWYYAAFGIACFAPRSLRWPVLALLVLAAGPAILAYLPLWLMGVLCFRLTQRLAPSPALGIGLLAAAAAILLTVKKLAIPTYGIHNSLHLNAAFVSTWTYYTGVGMAFGCTLLAVHVLAAYLPGFGERIERPVRWTAGATFTLYLMHDPILQVIATATRSPLILVSFTLAAVLLLAEIGERRKDVWALAFRVGAWRHVGTAGKGAESDRTP